MTKVMKLLGLGVSVNEGMKSAVALNMSHQDTDERKRLVWTYLFDKFGETLFSAHRAVVAEITFHIPIIE